MRHGSQPGAVFLVRSKIRIDRPRVRGKDGKEAKIPAYENLRSCEQARKKVHDSVLAGVSTRKYKKAVEDSLEAVGCSKSTISRRFIEESSARVAEFLAQKVPGDLVAVMLDGIRMGNHLVVVCIGIDSGGNKHALSVLEGTTENAATVRLLLEDLVDRGMNIQRKLLFIVDGAKALFRAIQDICGTHHPIQRCRVHKMRNVQENLPRSKKAYVRSVMTAAWMLPFKQGLQKMRELAEVLELTHREAARSLLEGLELTFTVNQLDLPLLLSRALGSTNLIENANGSIRAATHRIAHYEEPGTAQRWAASVLIEAQKNFQILQGYKDLWILQVALGHSTETEDELKRKAS